MAGQAYGSGNGRIETVELRRFLIDCARRKRSVSYGEVAEAFGEPWHQGTGSSLKKALNELGRQNKEAGEPLLMVLVVNKQSSIPGPGYFNQVGEADASADRRRELADAEFQKCFSWDWAT